MGGMYKIVVMSTSVNAGLKIFPMATSTDGPKTCICGNVLLV